MVAMALVEWVLALASGGCASDSSGPSQLVDDWARSECGCRLTKLGNVLVLRCPPFGGAPCNSRACSCWSSVRLTVVCIPQVFAHRGL
mmetsp:Transcript_37827/g.121678  ORF Transcript_37827/g.121678 Transcript_37827/m.121678 type:complete len:88 (+) Transcript_37827:2348-2611(+)